MSSSPITETSSGPAGLADVRGAWSDGARGPAHDHAGEVGRDRVRPAQDYPSAVAGGAHAVTGPGRRLVVARDASNTDMAGGGVGTHRPWKDPRACTPFPPAGRCAGDPVAGRHAGRRRGPTERLRTAAAPHPVRPQVHRLRLAGVNQAALADLRRQQPGARPAVLTPPRSTEDFRLLGVSWTPGAGVPEVEVEVRTRDARGWSRWQPLELEGAIASPRGALAAADDHASTRAGTEPLYTGPSSGVQVRVDGSGDALPADLRVDLVDPAPPRPTPGSAPRRCPPAQRTPRNRRS